MLSTSFWLALMGCAPTVGVPFEVKVTFDADTPVFAWDGDAIEYVAVHQVLADDDVTRWAQDCPGSKDEAHHDNCIESPIPYGEDLDSRAVSLSTEAFVWDAGALEPGEYMVTASRSHPGPNGSATQDEGTGWFELP